MNNVDEPVNVKGIIFVSESIAEQSNLVIDSRKTNASAHFVSFNLSVETGKVDFYDAIFSEDTYEQVVNRKALMRLLNRLLSLLTNKKIRSIRKFSYNRLSFSQKGLECGPLASLITIISHFVDNYYIQKFVIKNYNTILARVKTLIAGILLYHKFDAGDFGF